jgi:uncharacterized membrane protein
LPEKPDIDKRLLEIVRESSPKTVRELLELAEKELGVSQKELLNHILKLNDEEKLGLNLADVKYSRSPTWLWIVVALSICAGLALFFIPDNSYPYAYIRNALGMILVIFLPGFSLTMALFPRKQIDTIERLALSIGLSLAMVAITGLVLNYTPWGIRLQPITISLLGLSIALSFVGALKQK